MPRCVKLKTSDPITLRTYQVKQARPDKLYSIIFRDGRSGPFTVTKDAGDGKVAFLLDADVTPEDIGLLTETPPLKRIAASDGAEIERPTPEQAYEFIHHHALCDVTLFV